MSSRQVVKVEHKVSVAAFTSRDEKCVGEGREEDTTEERCEGVRERRFCLKVTFFLFCSQWRRSHFSLPVLTLIFPALLPCLVERLSLHCSPN